MRWLAVAGALGALWLAGAAWILLRDRGAFDLDKVGASRAAAAAHTLACPSCRGEVVGPVAAPTPGRWRLRLTDADNNVRCVIVDLPDIQPAGSAWPPATQPATC